ncbi:50S ribosomal protein L4 [Rickettsiales endosymbiont of Stachyamoeba lipophora]|uniref:50S ribosomal protein L4 n=1 Tax=Rickettsiales endosymbiont of Stachyamoeba lipophora TaxID=2486578 RepID=UPI000F654636|nr:50S ribosomal protein L4 [Rickettsiales endosymbiont of Stachyamoeba lipophora]AZL15865.1 50S ribosomal protein L4 [Rickettsiales endosymbiont of Stachyamoeba lipophora]
MDISIVNLSNEVIDKVQLSEDIFGYESRPDILHRVVLWQLAKRQAGTHKTKGISELSGTTKKPYAQKGTGRARQGSLRSPQFRGGAVIFGPVVRSHAISLPKKMRKLGLCHALSDKHQGGSLIVVDNLDLENGKTAELNNIIKKFNFDSVLFVDQNNQSEKFKRACSNLINIDVLPVMGLNVYDILRHKNLVITKQALVEIEERLQ